MIVLLYLWRRRTTVFGYIVISIGVIASSDGLFTPQTMKWLLLINGVLTACLGHYNNRRPPPTTD
jgi:hypothetical protein